MIKGIDVSKNQPKIDWQRVRQGGYSFAIIRAGYQGYTKGALREDAMLRAHMEGALAAGMEVGAYWICQAVNENEAHEAAAFCAHLLRPYPITLPVYWDMEPTAAFPAGRADLISRETRTKNGAAFLSEIERQGYRGGIYTNPDYLTYKLDAAAFDRYSLWLAQWNRSAPTRECDLWQYDAAAVPGVSGKCDRNVLNNTRLLGKKTESAETAPVEVTASALNMRAGAGVNHPILAVLPRGTRVQVQRRSAGWGLVEANGKQGWISMSFTRPVKPHLS